MSILDALAELETAEPCSMGAPTAKDESAIVSIAVASEYQGLAMKRYVDIAKAIETIEEGQTIHLAHHGGFSCDQVLIRLAEIIGPAHFRAATWILSRIPAMHMVRAAQSGAYLSCKFMLDVRALLFQQVAVDILHESFGFDAVRFREIHAKAYWLENDTASISMIGSANLTENPRLEIFTITRSRQVGDFWRDWFDSQWKISKPFQTYRAKKAETDTTRTLVILRGLPGSGKTTWSDLNLPDATVASRGPFLTNPLTGKFEWTADAEIAYRRHRAKLVRSHVFKKTMATVVMDDVHARLSSFKADIDLARASHITVRVIRFDTPIEVCLASQTHNVPEEVVRKMAADFEDYPGEEIIKHVDR